jgi:excisionase family DNA binding protein
MIDPTAFLTTKEVADKLKVDTTFVLSEIRARRLEAHQIGKGYRISEEALKRYLEITKVRVK